MTNIFLKILILSWLNRITILRLYANNIFSSFLNSSLRDSMTCLANLESYALIVFRRVEWEVIKHPIAFRLFIRWFSCFRTSFLLNSKDWFILLWIWIEIYFVTLDIWYIGLVDISMFFILKWYCICILTFYLCWSLEEIRKNNLRMNLTIYIKSKTSTIPKSSNLEDNRKVTSKVSSNVFVQNHFLYYTFKIYSLFVHQNNLNAKEGI